MARLSCIVAIFCIALMCAIAEELYDDTFDNINATEILQNEQKREEYFKCFLDEGPCVTPDEKFFKEIIYEALNTGCKKCTEKQKSMLKATADWYEKNNPKKWQRLVEKAKTMSS